MEPRNIRILQVALGAYLLVGSHDDVKRLIKDEWMALDGSVHSVLNRLAEEWDKSFDIVKAHAIFLQLQLLKFVKTPRKPISCIGQGFSGCQNLAILYAILGIHGSNNVRYISNIHAGQLLRESPFCNNNITNDELQALMAGLKRLLYEIAAENVRTWDDAFCAEFRYFEYLQRAKVDNVKWLKEFAASLEGKYDCDGSPQLARL